MTKRILTAVAVFGAASVISGCELKQPSAGCIVQDASVKAWQASYILKTPEVADQTCGKLKGERIGVWKFTNPEASAEQVASNTASTLAIRPSRLAALTSRSYTYKTGELDKEGKPVEKTVTKTVDRSEWGMATAQSQTLPEEPDSNGFCKATGFAEASITVPAVFNEVNDTKEELPAASRTYQYGDIEVYSHPAAPGTQLRGTLTYTDSNCTAQYDVLAVWPSVPCVVGSTDPVENCGPGSGLNPDFKAVCVAGIGASGGAACVPDPTVGLTLVGK